MSVVLQKENWKLFFEIFLLKIGNYSICQTFFLKFQIINKICDSVSFHFYFIIWFINWCYRWHFESVTAYYMLPGAQCAVRESGCFYISLLLTGCKKLIMKYSWSNVDPQHLYFSWIILLFTFLLGFVKITFLSCFCEHIQCHILILSLLMFDFGTYFIVINTFKLLYSLLFVDCLI